MSEKGMRMAKSIAEFMFMRYFFPKMKDRKKFHRIKNEFVTDMRFNLTKGTIQKATLKCGSKVYLVSHNWIYILLLVKYHQNIPRRGGELINA